MASALRTYRCPECEHEVAARGAIEVAHPCPRRRTKSGQPRMTQMEVVE